MGFLKFLFIKKRRRRRRRTGFRYSHCVEKRSHELVLCHSLMVDSFRGSKSSFFRLSLSLSDCMFFLGSKLNLVWHSHVRYWWSNKGLGMGFGFALKFEN